MGRTASAWATFREAASKAEAARESGRAKAGMERADELEPSLSKVTFLVAEENRDIEGLRIQQAGLDVSRPLWGTPVPVDPGDIMVTAEAPGYEKFELEVKVKQGPASVDVKIPPLVALPEEATPSDPAPGEATSPVPVDPAEPADPGAGRRTAGIVLGGVGVVGLGVGGVFGLVAMNHESKARDVCTDGLCDPTSDGVERTNKAQSAALVSTIGFAAGGALLAGGLVLYFTAPKAKETATLSGAPKLRLAPTPGGASLTWGTVF
jgi:serine/threonine-protein kinase